MKLCFVIMPIGSDDAYRTYLNRYENLIKPAIENLTVDGSRLFEAIRADFISSTGSINRTVLRHLYEADVVIADLTDLNANVFYELGVRHALRNGTILMALKGTVLPFDVGDMRVVVYEDRLGGEKTTTPQIQRLLTALATAIQDDSPVFVALPELGAPALRASAEAEARIAALESEARELRAKLAITEQVSLNFRESFSTFEQTVRSMLNRLDTEERASAESVVEQALLAEADRQEKRPILASTVEEDPRALFVLMPFRAEMSAVYEIIRSAAEYYGFRVFRADEIYGTGLIIDEILDAIRRAKVIVADLTGRNPNVLYEVGIAHSLNKNVILLAERGEQLPFDVAARRVIFYENSVDGASKLSVQLSASLEEIVER